MFPAGTPPTTDTRDDLPQLTVSSITVSGPFANFRGSGVLEVVLVLDEDPVPGEHLGEGLEAHAVLLLSGRDPRLEHIIERRDDGGRVRYDTDADRQWTIHRLWIAAGNEAVAYAAAVGLNPARDDVEPAAAPAQSWSPTTAFADLDEDQLWRTAYGRNR